MPRKRTFKKRVLTLSLLNVKKRALHELVYRFFASQLLPVVQLYLVNVWEKVNHEFMAKLIRDIHGWFA